MTGEWVVLVPLKRLSGAKSRMTCPVEHRQDLARAMADTVLATASRVPAVREVVLVTAEPWRGVAAPVRVIAEPPAGGLNASLAHAARLVARSHPRCGVAALLADTAAATVEELTACLTAAAAHPRAFVADHTGTGTVLLTARPGVALDPCFGPRSQEQHARSGAVDLSGFLDLPLLRRDLDTAEDLAAVDGRLRQLAPITAALGRAGWSGERFEGPIARVGVGPA